MARYIDADELYKATQKRIAEANKARMAVVDDEFLDLINDAFTEDVAPRAEVNEAYWEGVEYGNKDGAALVAREIFEEIEKIIKGPFAVGFCMTASSFRQAISDYNEGIRKEILYYIAELKKKYTQSEPPKGD